MEDENEVENIKLESNFGHTKDEENRKQKHNVKRNQQRPAGNVSKRFTPEDDQVLIDAIEKSEDKLDINQLARDLDRNRSSIIHRIEKLKAGETRRKVRTYYTLEEDIVMTRCQYLAHLREHFLKKFAPIKLKYFQFPL
jgi:hypothetical protein